MSLEIHIDWRGQTRFVGRLHMADRGSSVSYDHLRNHGFLMREPGRWSLSPAYDLNPVPEVDRGRTNKTAISEASEETTIAGTMAVSERFGLNSAAARKILNEVYAAVSGWRRTAQQLRLSAASIDAYVSAFENPLTGETRRLLGR